MEKRQVNSYRDLEVWQKGIDLVQLAYSIGEKLPKSESYGLTSQLQRASVSVPANIAEGHARKSSKEFLQFISIALGSLAEVENISILWSGSIILMQRKQAAHWIKANNWGECCEGYNRR